MYTSLLQELASSLNILAGERDSDRPLYTNVSISITMPPGAYDVQLELSCFDEDSEEPLHYVHRVCDIEEFVAHEFVVDLLSTICSESDSLDDEDQEGLRLLVLEQMEAFLETSIVGVITSNGLFTTISLDITDNCLTMNTSAGISVGDEKKIAIAMAMPIIRF